MNQNAQPKVLMITHRGPTKELPLELEFACSPIL